LIPVFFADPKFAEWQNSKGFGGSFNGYWDPKYDGLVYFKFENNKFILKQAGIFSYTDEMPFYSRDEQSTNMGAKFFIRDINGDGTAEIIHHPFTGTNLIVFVKDIVPPTIKLKSNATFKLDENLKLGIEFKDIDNGTFDDVKIDKIIISKTNFDCSNLGKNKIDIEVIDHAGNKSKSIYEFIIESKFYLDNVSIYLPSSGNKNITYTELLSTTRENCELKDITLSKSTFTCADLGVKKITFTAKDASGNSSSEEVTINVIDSIKPIIKSKVAYSVSLDAQREGAIKWEDIDEGSSDNCSIKERVFSKSKFTCADIGVNEITYTVTDVGGNSTSTLIKVTVNPAPEVTISAAGPTTITQTGNVVLSGSTGTGFTYQWYKDDVAIASATASSHTARLAGSYKLKLTTLNGCETLSNSIIVKTIFVLPANNYQINIQGETCRTSDNGKIAISAVQNLNYTATLSKSGQAVKTANFNTGTDLTGLAAGNYTLCFTVAGQTEYKQCYELTITEPLDLSVYSKVNPVNNTLDLLMSGGETYYITLNGEKYTSYTSKMSLGLKAGLNKITVNSSQICQGLYTEEIYVDEKIQAYPNPFSSILNLKIENQENKELLVRVVDRYGLSAYEAKHVVVNNLVTLDLSKLDNDYYFVVIGKQTFKVIKQ
jgi:hypothetical protein